jgi:N-acetylmuramoyl-L-alanine amidase
MTALRPENDDDLLFTMDMKAKKIAIDVGHARGTGASGNFLQEHEVCVALAELLRGLLEERGVEAEVIDFPGKTNAGDLAETVRAVNEGGFDLCVSLHCDASDNALAKGAHVIYVSEKGREAAGYVAKHLCALLPGRANKLVQRGNLYVLNNTRCVAILCECGFLTNADNAWMLRENKIGIARAIMLGIMDWVKA